MVSLVSSDLSWFTLATPISPPFSQVSLCMILCIVVTYWPTSVSRSSGVSLLVSLFGNGSPSTSSHGWTRFLSSVLETKTLKFSPMFLVDLPTMRVLDFSASALIGTILDWCSHLCTCLSSLSLTCYWVTLVVTPCSLGSTTPTSGMPSLSLCKYCKYWNMHLLPDMC